MWDCKQCCAHSWLEKGDHNQPRDPCKSGAISCSFCRWTFTKAAKGMQGRQDDFSPGYVLSATCVKTSSEAFFLCFTETQRGLNYREFVWDEQVWRTTFDLTHVYYYNDITVWVFFPSSLFCTFWTYLLIIYCAMQTVNYFFHHFLNATLGWFLF